VQRVQVSVAVPQSYYDGLWKKEYPTPPGRTPRLPEPSALSALAARESEKIEKLVSNLLPVAAAPAAAQNLVAVSTFNPLERTIHEQPIEWRDVALAWGAEHGSHLALGAMGLVGLLVLRSILRSPPRPSLDRTETKVSPETVSFQRADEPAGLAGPHGRRATQPAPAGGVFQGELADMVRDDPNAAASVLRTWIGNAS
jgi:flagellar M-ring protein FliF